MMCTTKKVKTRSIKITNKGKEAMLGSNCVHYNY